SPLRRLVTTLSQMCLCWLAIAKSLYLDRSRPALGLGPPWQEVQYFSRNGTTSFLKSTFATSLGCVLPWAGCFASPERPFIAPRTGTARQHIAARIPQRMQRLQAGTIRGKATDKRRGFSYSCFNTTTAQSHRKITRQPSCTPAPSLASRSL